MLKKIGALEFFGERALFYEEKWSATVIAKKWTTVLTLSKEEFTSIINSGNSRQFIENWLKLQDVSVTLQELKVINDLGNGTFGKVYEVICEWNNTKYALKIVDRSVIYKYNIQDHIKTEKQVLE